MKNLELTESHRIKLLKICEKLFPEYLKIELEINPQYDGIDGFLQLQKLDKNKNFVYNYIYWFELCWIILNKILENNISPNYTMSVIGDFGVCCFNQLESDHPVDRLYNEFLKLKI